MEKMAFHLERRWRIWQAWGSAWRWLRNWAYELLTGYGERPWNSATIGVMSVFAFAIGYVATGAVSGFVDALVFRGPEST